MWIQHIQMKNSHLIRFRRVGIRAEQLAILLGRRGGATDRVFFLFFFVSQPGSHCQLGSDGGQNAGEATSSVDRWNCSIVEWIVQWTLQSLVEIHGSLKKRGRNVSKWVNVKRSEVPWRRYTATGRQERKISRSCRPTGRVVILLVSQPVGTGQ